MSNLLPSSPTPGQSAHQEDIKPKAFAGHSGHIYAIWHSSDGKQIATAGNNPLLRKWDSDTGELMLEFEGSQIMDSMYFSPDGKRLAGGNKWGEFYIWDTSDGRLIFKDVKSQSSVDAVAYSPDGKLIAVHGDAFPVEIWHTEDMTRTEMVEHPGRTRSVTFSPDGRRLATGCEDGKIRIFDVATGVLTIGPLEGHTGDIGAIAYHTDGEQLASCSDDRTIRIWDATTGDMLLGPLEGHFASVGCIVYSPDGKRLLSGSKDKTIRLWDLNTGKTIGGPIRGHENEVLAASFAPDGTRFVTGGYGGSMRLWDGSTQEIILPELTEDEKERYRLRGPFRGHTNSITAVAYFPDGTRIASASSDEAVRIWDAHTGKLLVGPLMDLPGRARGMVQSIAISSDGERLASGARGLRVWDSRTGDLLLGPLHEDRLHGVSCVRFSPDDRLIATSYEYGPVLLWDSQTGTQLSSPERHENIQPLSFSSDGRLLAGGGRDRSINIWDVSTAKVVAGPFQGHTDVITAVCFSPDGLRIVSGSDDATVRVWDPKTGATILGPLKAPNTVSSVSYSPDGARICSTSGDGTVCLWHATTGDLVLGPLHCHKSGSTSAAFSPEGKHIVTGSEDETIKVLDAATGKMIQFPDFEPDNADSSDSVLDLPATAVPRQTPHDQPQDSEIRLGSLSDLLGTTEIVNTSTTASGRAENWCKTTLLSFSRVLDAISNIFRGSQPVVERVELGDRPLRLTVPGPNGKERLLFVSPEPSSRRPQAFDESDTDTVEQHGNEGQNMTVGQGDNEASGSGAQEGEDTSDAAQGTRHGVKQGTPSMERPAPYSAAPPITFGTERVESEDSSEAYCCACCPSWCTCFHP